MKNLAGCSHRLLRWQRLSENHYQIVYKGDTFVSLLLTRQPPRSPLALHTYDFRQGLVYTARARYLFRCAFRWGLFSGYTLHEYDSDSHLGQFKDSFLHLPWQTQGRLFLDHQEAAFAWKRTRPLQWSFAASEGEEDLVEFTVHRNQEEGWIHIRRCDFFDRVSSEIPLTFGLYMVAGPKRFMTPPIHQRFAKEAATPKSRPHRIDAKVTLRHTDGV